MHCIWYILLHIFVSYTCNQDVPSFWNIELTYLLTYLIDWRLLVSMVTLFELSVISSVVSLCS